MAERKPLTKKQERFAQSYALHLNGAHAAREAGVPPKSARRIAHKWLNDPKFAHVLEYVDELLADDAAQRKRDWDILRQRLRSRLTVDVRRYYDKEGKPRNPRRLKPELAQHIQSYSYSTYTTHGKDGNVVQEGVNANVVLTSATKAEELLGRHSGFFVRESTGDQYADYLEADRELEAILQALPDEDGDDEEDSPEDEAGGDDSE